MLASKLMAKKCILYTKDFFAGLMDAYMQSRVCPGNANDYSAASQKVDVHCYWHCQPCQNVTSTSEVSGTTALLSIQAAMLESAWESILLRACFNLTW